MTNQRRLLWWAYVVSGIVLLGAVVPALISASDTMLVLIGLALLVAYATWSWYLWIKELIELGMPKVEADKLREKLNEKGNDDDKA